MTTIEAPPLDAVVEAPSSVDEQARRLISRAMRTFGKSGAYTEVWRTKHTGGPLDLSRTWQERRASTCAGCSDGGREDELVRRVFELVDADNDKREDDGVTVRWAKSFSSSDLNVDALLAGDFDHVIQIRLVDIKRYE